MVRGRHYSVLATTNCPLSVTNNQQTGKYDYDDDDDVVNNEWKVIIIALPLLDMKSGGGGDTIVRSLTSLVFPVVSEATAAYTSL